MLVSDNGTHFTAESVTRWLSGLGCKHLFTAPRHPCSNGQAENFVKTLKSVINSLRPSSFKELEQGVDNFLLQYRNATHSTTGESPAKLLKGRVLRSNMSGLKNAEISYYRGNDLRPSSGIVLKNLGNAMVSILDMDDLSVHNRHIDQILYETKGESVPINSVSTPTNNSLLDNIDDAQFEVSNEVELRRSRRLQSKTPVNYTDPRTKCTLGGCDEC